MSARPSRNIIQSAMEYIRTCLDDPDTGWSGVTVVKQESKIDENIPPIIYVRLAPDTNWNDLEIGSDSVMRNPTLLVEIFGKSDINRMDLKDYLIDMLKSGFPYNEYEIGENDITLTKQNGYVTLNGKIGDKEEDVGIPKSALVAKYRYRHLLSLPVINNLVE